jgi:hypothetical protein
MSNSILIIGDSGTGKSTAMRTLEPTETFVINVLGKSFPFRGFKSKFKDFNNENKDGNYYFSDNMLKVKNVIKFVNKERPDIKNIVIDDAGFLLSNEFMRKAQEKGYDKYSILAQSFFDILSEISLLREDLFCFVMMHVEIDALGKTKPKTIGKMIDQYSSIEAKFTYTFHTMIIDGEYKFLTNNDGQHMAKSSMGLYAEPYIDNDLQKIKTDIINYNEGDL